MSHLDDNNDELARELRNRSEDVGGHPIDFDSVRHTARGIQRRRRIAGGIAAAAVLAVVVPAGMAASDNLDLGQGQEPAGQPTTAVSVVSPAVSASEPSVPDPSATATTARETTATEPTPTETTATEPKPTNKTTATEPTATNSATEPTEPTSSSTSPDPSAGKTVDLTAAGAIRGPDPAIRYLIGQTLMLPGGDTIDLGADYVSIAPHQDGWVAHGQAGAGVRLFFLNADGSVRESQPGNYGMALSVNREYVVYAGAENGVLHLAPTSGQGETYTFNIDADGPVTPAGAGLIVQDPVEDRGVIFYNVDGREPRAWVASLHGTGEQVRPFRRLTGLAPDGSMAGIVSVSDSGSCSQVRNSNWSLRWETCKFYVERFSPDGRYVLATHAYRDGIGDSQITILDAQTGDVVVSYERPTDGTLFVNAMVWEDNSHALATVYEDGAWRIIRLDLDGNIEAASSAVEGDEISIFRFTAQP